MGTARDPSVNVGSGDPLSTSTGGRENHFIFASILENRGCYINKYGATSHRNAASIILFISSYACKY